MVINDFTLVVYFITKIIHSSACTVWLEYLNNISPSFEYDFIFIGMGLDNDFPIQRC